MRNPIVLACVFFVATAEGQICDSSISDSVAAQTWRAIQHALELHHPTEVQRLSRLRGSIMQLAEAKRNLIQTVEGVVNAQSIPGWLRFRFASANCIIDPRN